MFLISCRLIYVQNYVCDEVNGNTVDTFKNISIVVSISTVNGVYPLPKMLQGCILHFRVANPIYLVLVVD